MCALTLIAPVTSRDSGFPLHVGIGEGNCIYGFVQCEALRAIDLDAWQNAGRAKRIGALDDATMVRVMQRVAVATGLA